jgi:hypothetical protein
MVLTTGQTQPKKEHTLHQRSICLIALDGDSNKEIQETCTDIVALCNFAYIFENYFADTGGLKKGKQGRWLYIIHSACSSTNKTGDAGVTGHQGMLRACTILWNQEDLCQFAGMT